MAPSPTCSHHCDIKHEYFNQAWKKWNYETFFEKFYEVGDEARVGFFDGRQLLRKITEECDHKCFGSNQQGKGRTTLTKLDQVQQSLALRVISRVERPF